MGDNLQTGLTPWNIDLASQQQDIDRRRQMLTALLMRSMQQQPTQMAGNIAIRQSPLSAIGNLLTAGLAQHGITGLGEDEQKLVKNAQEQSSQAMNELGKAGQYQPGTNTTVNEEAGPPDENGKPSVSVYPGKAGGIDSDRFYKAYGKAQGKVDPKILGDMLSQFDTNRMLLGNPETAQFVPGYAGSQGQPTTGVTSQGGVSLSIPAANAGATPGGGAPAGGGLLGVPGVAAALTLSGKPNMMKLGEMINKNAEPINTRPGGSVVVADGKGGYRIALTAPVLPQGTRVNAAGNVESLPGVEDINARRLGKEESIKAGYKQVTVDNSDGSKSSGYLGEGGVFHPFSVAPTGAGAVPGNAPVGAAPAGAVPQGQGAAPGSMTFPPGTPPGQMKVTPDAMNVATNGRVALLMEERSKRQQQGLPPDPALEQEIAIQQRAGVVRQGVPAANPELFSAQGVQTNRSQSTTSKAESEGMGKALADQQSQVDENARNAQSIIARSQEMRTALEAFTPNAGEPVRQKLAEVAAAIPGISKETVEGLAGGSLAAQQVFGKHAAQNAFETVRASLGAGQRITQQEMLLNYKNSANPSMTKEAITAILSYQEGAAKYAIEKQALKDQYVEQKGSYAGFEGWWNRTHPLTQYIPTEAEMKAALFPKDPPKTGKEVKANPYTALSNDELMRKLSGR